MAEGFRFTVNPGADHAVGEALEKYFSEQLGPRIQGNAKRTVPVLSGDLKRSIVLQVSGSDDEAILQVGVDQDVADVDYGRYVEEGTSRMAAQPYLRPAVYQARGTL